MPDRGIKLNLLLLAMANRRHWAIWMLKTTKWTMPMRPTSTEVHLLDRQPPVHQHAHTFQRIELNLNANVKCTITKAKRWHWQRNRSKESWARSTKTRKHRRRRTSRPRSRAEHIERATTNDDTWRRWCAGPGRRPGDACPATIRDCQWFSKLYDTAVSRRSRK